MRIRAQRTEADVIGGGRLARLRRLGSTEALVLALASIGIGVAAALNATILMLASPPIILAVVMAMVHARVRLWTLSPIVILVVAYSVVGISGPAVAGVVSASVTSGSITLSPFEEVGAYFVLLIAATAGAVGAMGYAVVRPKGWMKVNWLAVKGGFGSNRARSLAAILSVIPLAVFVVAHGTDLLIRPVYSNLSTSDLGNPILIGAGTLSLPAVAVLGWLSQESATGAGRFASLIGVLSYGLVLFALASRAFALLPLMATLGMVAARPTRHSLRITLVVTAVGSLFLLQLPLSLRNSGLHGLVPYAGIVAQSLVAIDVQALLTNVFFAFQLTGRVGFGTQGLPIDTLLKSFNPLPGQLSGWYDVQPELRLNLYIPYNSTGELANYGWPILVAFYFVAGAYLSHVDKTMRGLLASGQGLVALTLFGLSCVFVVDTLQYNLRSSIRIWYYMIAIELAIVAIRKFGSLLRRREMV